MLEFMKKNPKIWIIIRSIIVIFIFWNNAIFQIIPITIFHLDNVSQSTTIQVFKSTFSSLITFLIFILIYWNDLKRDFKVFTNHFVENMDAGIRWWLLGLFIMVLSNIIITYVLKGGGAENEKIVQNLLSSVPWLMFITAGVLAPLNEEIVFRKVVKDCIPNKWIFVSFSFLLFGLGHVVGNATNFISLLYIIPYGALGGVFALAYSETDTIFTSIVMHMIHNTILVLLSIFVL